MSSQVALTQEQNTWIKANKEKHASIAGLASTMPAAYLGALSALMAEHADAPETPMAELSEFFDLGDHVLAINTWTVTHNPAQGDPVSQRFCGLGVEFPIGVELWEKLNSLVTTFRRLEGLEKRITTAQKKRDSIIAKCQKTLEKLEDKTDDASVGQVLLAEKRMADAETEYTKETQDSIKERDSIKNLSLLWRTLASVFTVRAKVARSTTRGTEKLDDGRYRVKLPACYKGDIMTVTDGQASLQHGKETYDLGPVSSGSHAAKVLYYLRSHSPEETREASKAGTLPHSYSGTLSFDVQ